MVKRYLLGIDIGCGGSKACIVDDEGNVIAYGFREHRIIVSKQSWSETDPNEYWLNICTIIREMLEKSGVDRDRIQGISVSSAVPALVMLDSDLNTVNLAYNFLDGRAREITGRLKGTVGAEKIFRLSAFNIEEQSVLTSLIWEKENRPGDFQKIFKALTPDGFVTLRLTDRPIVNYSAATFYGLAFDIRKKRFDADMLAEIGIPADILPEVFPCEEVVGSVTRKASELTGLSTGTPVLAGTVDAFAGWLGGAAIHEGDIHINLGTAAVMGVITGRERFIRDMWNCIYPMNSRKNYVIFGSTTTGGYLLRYFRDSFGAFERSVERDLGVDSYDLLNLEAEKTPPGSDGLLVLPHFMGARVPQFNRNARGILFGWSLNHTKGHVIRALMEGVAFSVYKQFQVFVREGVPLSGTLVMNEGGAKSRLWRRIFADVFGMPTVMVKNRTGAPYGNAFLAGVSTGVFDGYERIRNWVEYVDRQEPDQKAHELYMRLFEIYNKIYADIEGDYDLLQQKLGTAL